MKKNNLEKVEEKGKCLKQKDGTPKSQNGKKYNGKIQWKRKKRIHKEKERIIYKGAEREWNWWKNRIKERGKERGRERELQKGGKDKVKENNRK